VIEKPTLAEQMQALPIGRWLDLPREYLTQQDVQKLIDRFGGDTPWVMRKLPYEKRRTVFQIRRAGEGDEQ
jgi:hypothetical protein